jgi:hypothetical protein
VFYFGPFVPGYCYKNKLPFKLYPLKCFKTFQQICIRADSQKHPAIENLMPNWRVFRRAGKILLHELEHFPEIINVIKPILPI